MEASKSTQANTGQSSNPLIIREGHQDGGQLRSATIISPQYVVLVPVLPQTQGGQPPNQQSSSGQTTPSQPALIALLSRRGPLSSSLIGNSDSQTACVYAQNGNLHQPKGKFENMPQSYKGQSNEVCQVSSQNSPIAIIAQQGGQGMASSGIPQQVVWIQQASNTTFLPQLLQYTAASNYFCSDSNQSLQTSSPSGQVLVTGPNTSVGLQRTTINNGVFVSNHVLPSSIGLYNANSLNALISQTGAFVANRNAQSPPSYPAPPPYPAPPSYPAPPTNPVRQDSNGTGTNDQSRNGSMVGNMIFMGGKPRENIFALQGQQQQGLSESSGSQVDQINTSRQPVHQVPQNNIQAHRSAAPGSSTHHRQKAIAVVQPLSQAPHAVTTHTLSIRKPVELLPTNATINPNAEAEAPTLDSPAALDTGQSPEQQGGHSQVSPSVNHQPVLSPTQWKDTEQGHPQVFPSVNHQPTLTPTQRKDTETPDAGVSQVPVNHASKETMETEGSVVSSDTETPDDTGVSQVPGNHASKETMETEGSVVLSEDTDLCSVPVIPWSYKKLKVLLGLTRDMDFSKFRKGAEIDVASTILARYWDGSYQKMMDALSAGHYKNVMAEVVEVCRHVTPQSVIFSHVRGEHLSRLKEKVLRLGHDAACPKTVHKSSWLNTNEQLDDIDKEYGLPWCLKNIQQTLRPQREEQLEPTGTDDDGSEAACEMQDVTPQPKTVSPGPEPNVVSEIKKPCVTHSCTQSDIPVAVKMECAEDDGSSDPFYSMKIHVLAPEEAKYLCLFEDVQVQSEECADQQKGVTLGSVGDELPEEVDVVFPEEIDVFPEEIDVFPEEVDVMLPEEIDVVFPEEVDVELPEEVDVMFPEEVDVMLPEEVGVVFPEEVDVVLPQEVDVELPEEMDVMFPEEMNAVLTDAKSENKVEDPMENFCCISSLMAKLRGVNCITPCPCQRKSAPTPETPTFKGNSLGEENSVDLNYLGVPKVKDRSVVKCGREVRSHASPAAFISTETEQQCIVDLDENSETYPSTDCEVEVCEVERDMSRKYARCMATLMAEPERCSGPPKWKVPGPQMNVSLDTTDSPNSQFPSTEEDLASLSSIQRHDNSLTSERNARVDDKSKRFGRKRKGSHSELSVLEKLYKISRLQSSSPPAVHNWSDHDEDIEPITTDEEGEHNTADDDIELIKAMATEEEQPQASTTQKHPKTVSVVQLALFGSSPQRRYGTVTTGKSRGKRTNPFTDRAPTPPLTINVSVTSRVREEGSSVASQGRKSPEVESRVAEGAVKERLLKDWKDSFVPMKTKSRREGSPEVKKKCVVNAASTKIDGILPEVPEGKPPAGSQQTKSKKESILNGLKLRLKNAQICPPERSKHEIGNPALRPSQESSPLSFSVLPESFSFREQEHTALETTAGSKADTGDSAVSWKCKSSRTTIQKPKVAWLTDSESQRKYSPLPSTKPNPLKSTMSAFKEFQGKYTENTENVEYQRKCTENTQHMEYQRKCTENTQHMEYQKKCTENTGHMENQRKCTENIIT